MQQHIRQHTIPIESSLGLNPSFLPSLSQTIKCPGCDRIVCRDPKSLLLHRKICTGSSTGLSCTNCLQLFVDRQQLIDHKKICKISLRKRDQSESNKRVETNFEGRFICSYDGCGKTLSSKKTLRQHMKRHNKPFTCKFRGCFKSFGSSWDRTIHERTHTVEKKEKCRFCLSRFKDPSGLRQHIKRFHKGVVVGKEKPYQCRMCRMPFRTKDDLQIHYKSHVPRQRKQSSHCGECGEFVSEIGMIKHKMKYCRMKMIRCDHDGHSWTMKSFIIYSLC